MLELLIIGYLLLWPVLCYSLARDKGRDTGLAVLSGLLFGVFAVLYYATVSRKD